MASSTQSMGPRRGRKRRSPRKKSSSAWRWWLIGGGIAGGLALVLGLWAGGAFRPKVPGAAPGQSDSDWTTLRGRKVSYSLSIPASWVKYQAQGANLEHSFKNPAGQFYVEVRATTARGGVANLGKRLVKDNKALSDIHRDVQLESSGPINVDGVQWIEARLLLTRTDGALFRLKARAFTGTRGTIIIQTVELAGADDPYGATTERIWASVRLD